MAVKTYSCAIAQLSTRNLYYGAHAGFPISSGVYNLSAPSDTYTPLKNHRSTFIYIETIEALFGLLNFAPGRDTSSQ